MSFKITYHPDVFKVDLPKINRNIQARIKKAIEDRLMTAPGSYGEPLSGSLHGLMKLRVGEYRIVFRLKEKDLLHIYIVMDRKDVYEDVYRRLY